MESSFCAVLPFDQLREGAMRTCEIGGREIVLCKTQNVVYALDNVCTHAEARMSEGRFRGMRIVCPLHGAAFDVRDGRVLSGPAVVALPTYAVQVRDGMIEVAPNQNP